MAEHLLLVATQVGILFALMAVGALCRRLKLLDEAAVKGLVNVLVLVVTPALIVHSFQRDFDPSKLAALGTAFGIAFAAHLVLIAAATGLVRHRAADTRCVLRLATVFSNAGFMGIPLENALFGADGVFYGIVYVVVFNVVMWSWGFCTMKGVSLRGLGRAQLLTVFVNPGTVGIALGLPLFLGSVHLPAVVARPVELLSDLNTPVAMLVIGYYLAGARLGSVLRSGGAYLAAAIRLVVYPLLLLESCLLPSLHLLLPGWQTSSPALSWNGVPLGGSPGFTGASLSSSTASLQIVHLAWEPLQPPWAVARIPSHLPFSLLGLCKGELHARVCPLLSILIQHLRSPPSNSPAPAGPPAVQLLSDPVSLEVVSDHTS